MKRKLIEVDVVIESEVPGIKPREICLDLDDIACIECLSLDIDHSVDHVKIYFLQEDVDNV